MTNNLYPANRRKEYSSQGRKRQLKENIREKRNKIIGAQDMVTATIFFWGTSNIYPYSGLMKPWACCKVNKKESCTKVHNQFHSNSYRHPSYRISGSYDGMCFQKERKKKLTCTSHSITCWAKLPIEILMRHRCKASCTPAGLGHQSSSTKDIRIASRVWIELPVSFITIPLKIQMGKAVLCRPFC